MEVLIIPVWATATTPASRASVRHETAIAAGAANYNVRAVAVVVTISRAGAACVASSGVLLSLDVTECVRSAWSKDAV